MAKSAELNGVPGPVHLLDLKDELNLSSGQIQKLTKLFETMQNRAVLLGEQFIALETTLDRAFQGTRPTVQTLGSLVRKIGEVRAELRVVHLSAHLKTPDIMTLSQVTKYNQLRGYGSNTPCSTRAAGHNEAMWRKHNGCE